MNEDDVGDSRDMSDQCVMKRYSKANLHTIVMVVPEVFQALMDLPRLIKERQSLKERLKKCTCMKDS
jgi:hypothetical protein